LDGDIGKIKIRRDKKIKYKQQTEKERSLRYDVVEKGGQQEEEEKKKSTTGVCLPTILRVRIDSKCYALFRNIRLVFVFIRLKYSIRDLLLVQCVVP